MKTPEEILKDQRLNISEFVRTGCLKAMEEYALQKLEQTVASYEIDRINLVAMTLERDELDEKYKEAIRDVKEYRRLFDEYKARYELTLACKDHLEDWLREYRGQLQKGNVFHKNQGIINAINDLLDENI